jgi:amino acid transporter/nucleotide-binding universal stress UspA family protein
VACSLYALGFGAYFAAVLKSLHVQIPGIGQPSDKALAVVVVILFGLINFRGASETGKAGIFVTLAKVLVIGFFIVIGLVVTIQHPNTLNNFLDFFPKGFGGVVTAMGLTFIAFQGYEIIAQCSEEVVDPKKNIPRAVFLSLIIVIPIYLLVAFVALAAANSGSMPTWQYLGKMKELALVEVAQHFISFGGLVILVGGLLSTMSALNATIFSSSRVAFAMGRDHNLPEFFSHIHKKFKTPHLALLVSNLVIIVMAVALPIEDVASAADIMFLALFIQVNIVLVRLRKILPNLDRGFRVPWVPLLPILGIVTQAGVALYMAFYSPRAWVTILLWIGTGFLIYKTYASKKEREALDYIRRIEKMERMEYRILAAISHPHTYRSIMQAAMPIARKHHGEIIGLSVAEVPDGQPLLQGMDQLPALEPVLAQAMFLAAEQQIPGKRIIKYAHRISHGIVETAREEDCNFILVGRGRHLNFIEKMFASVVDIVIQQTPVEVGIVVGDIPREVRTILFPHTNQTHTLLAQNLLPAYCEYYGAEARIVRVVPPGTDRDVLAKVELELREVFADATFRVTPEVIVSNNVVSELRQAARGCQLIIMGGAPMSLLEQFIAPPIPLQLADQTDTPMIIVRKYGKEDYGTRLS